MQKEKKKRFGPLQEKFVTYSCGIGGHQHGDDGQDSQAYVLKHHVLILIFICCIIRFLFGRE